MATFRDLVLSIEELIVKYNAYVIKDNQIYNDYKVFNDEEKERNDELAEDINMLINKLTTKLSYIPIQKINDSNKTKRVLNTGEKYKHLMPIESIEKIKIGDSLSKIFVDVNNLIIMPKLNGISCIVWYDKFTLNYVTKHNTEYGENISNICNIRFPDYNSILIKFFKENEDILGVRGELLFSKSYQTNGSKLSDLAGLIRNKYMTNDIKEKLKHLELVIYFVYSKTLEMTPNLIKYLTILEKMNIKVINFTRLKCLDDIQNETFLQLEEKYSFLNVDGYEIDGYIIRDTSLVYRYSVAIKKFRLFSAIVTKIAYQYGNKTGRFTPLIYFNHEENFDKKISKVTGYNNEFMYSNKIKIGSKIEIIYKGETICLFNKTISSSWYFLNMESYLEYLLFITKLDCIRHNNEFVKMINRLNIFINNLDIYSLSYAMIDNYLYVVYPDCMEDVGDYKLLYKKFIEKLEEFTTIEDIDNEYMPLRTVKYFTNEIIQRINDKDITDKLTIYALAIPGLTYDVFNKNKVNFKIIKDSDEIRWIDIKRTSDKKSIQLDTIIEHKDVMVYLYNLFYSFNGKSQKV